VRGLKGLGRQGSRRSIIGTTAASGADEWYPLDFRFTVVVVAKGGGFSGWDTYLNPTPRPR